jgi:hypothetical protein
MGPICGCPLLVPFCGPSPFGMLRLPVLICLKGVSLGNLLLAAVPFRICVGAPLLNMLGGRGRGPRLAGGYRCRTVNVGSRVEQIEGRGGRRADCSLPREKSDGLQEG